CAGGALQFTEHALDVGAYCAWADAKLACDLLVALADAYALQYLCLTLAQWAVAGLARCHSAFASSRSDDCFACLRVEASALGFAQQELLGFTVIQGGSPRPLGTQRLPGQGCCQQAML